MKQPNISHHLFMTFSFSVLSVNLSKIRKLPNPELSMKSKGVTTQMKALNKYILMVLFVITEEFIFL